ncbi:PTS system mannose/fructose/sorbose family transporter subunit IID [Brachyspira sp.]|uniref:PTS system mannose/fructose/sorbose family transporter subunit IID n=1 Tax=Brachyspira sp. TaxID=1977261 RepID=UPI002629037D|nr:PTS system mannose/fructose/sorbose family transporter subunit IID [Brachyspira sp.]
MENKKITKRDLIRVFFRSMSLEWTWNYVKQQHMGFSFALIPVLKKLYGDNKEKLTKALRTHLEFFNTTQAVSTFIMGVTVALEEEKVKNDSDDYTTIRSIKTALMGPLAGIGDAIVLVTLRTIATSIAAGFCLKGNIIGPIIFLLVFNIPHYIIRYFGTFIGYNMGIKILKQADQSGIMSSINYAISIIGLMVIGGMTADYVNINIGFNIGSAANPITIQSILDSIMPKIAPLGITLLIYYLLGKHISINWMLLAVILIGILGCFFGILV